MGEAERFKRCLRAGNKSEKAVSTQLEPIQQLDAYLAASGMPRVTEAISREHIQSFIGAILRRWKPAIASNRYRALQSFFKYQTDVVVIQRSPMERMKAPIVPDQPPPVLNEEQVKRLLVLCQKGPRLRGV